MVVADRARYLPCAVFVLPQGYELGLSHAIFRAVRMVEAMNANLHRAIILERIHLERSRYQPALHLAADVLLNRCEKRRLTQRQPRLVVIELQVVSHHRAQLREIAVVVGIEELGVERLYRLEESVGWLVRLCLGSRAKKDKHHK